jgi:hypothetical protein
MHMLVDDLSLHYIMLGCAHERKACGGAVDRRGKQKPGVCDTRGPYQTIRSIMKQVT